MTDPDEIDRAIAGGSAARLVKAPDEPEQPTIWQRIFRWLDWRISRWIGGG